MIAMFRSRSLGNMASGRGGVKGAHYTALGSRYQRERQIARIQHQIAKKRPRRSGAYILPKQVLGLGGLEVHYRCIPLTRDWIRAADRIQESDVVVGFGIIVARLAGEDDGVAA